MNFRLSAEIPIWKIKLVTPIRNFLNQYSVYLDQTFLFTTDNVKVGSLILSHCQYTRRDCATKDINARINSNEETQTPIQLTPYTIYNGANENKISTKVLAVECAKEHIREVRRRLFTKLITIPKKWN